MNRAVARELLSLGYDSLVAAGESDDAPAVQRETWRDLQRKVGGDPAIHFANGVPLVAADSIDDPHQLRSLQNRYWNFGRIPLFFTIVGGELTAYAATRQPARASDASDVMVASGIGHLSSFAREEMDVGRGLTQLASRYSQGSERVDSALLRNIRELRRRHASASPGAVETMLGGALLVRYMEDRGILDDEHMAQLCGYDRLSDVLGDGMRPTIRLFEALASRFNGDVFGNFEQRSHGLTHGVLDDVAALLNGDNLATGQISMWPYNFEAIPTVLISSIYEELLNDVQQINAAHYTPTWLIDVVLDEVLPWDGLSIPTVLDPACGSGAFLAAAYNRLLSRQERAAGHPLTFSESIDLLRSKIFGFEISEAASSITIFGLYLTLLERQDPTTVWTHGRLPNLSTTNVLTTDAFSARTAVFDDNVDVLVGNPPWQSDLREPVRKWLAAEELTVADKRLDQAFLWRSHKLLADGGELGVVLPKGVLVNSSTTAVQFREDYFAGFGDRLIIDLAELRNTLFTSARIPAAVLCMTKNRPSSDGTLIEPQRTLITAPNHPANKAIDGLVLAPSDVVTTPDSSNTRTIDPLDSSIVAAIARYPRLHQRFTASRGLQRKGGGNQSPDFLSGLPFLPRKSLGRLHIGDYEPALVDPVHRRRSRVLYSAPFIAVGRSVNFRDGIQATYIENDCTFDDTVIGIHVSSDRGDDSEGLKSLLGFLLSDLCLYWHIMTGSTLGPNARRVIGVNEHEMFPVAEASPQLNREIDRLLASSRRDFTLLNRLVYESYGINTAYQNRIEVVVRELISGVTGQGRYRRPDVGEMTKYLRRLEFVLNQLVNSTFPAMASRLVADAVPGFTTVEVALSVRADIDVSTIRELFTRARNPEQGLSRVIQQDTAVLFDGSSIYVVKPAEQRFWTESAVDHDVAEVLHALYAAKSAS